MHRGGGGRALRSPLATTSRYGVSPEPGPSAQQERGQRQVPHREAEVYSARMSGTVIWNTRRRRTVAILVACLVGTWLAALAAPPALAHEGDSDQASVLVLWFLMMRPARALASGLAPW